jgi:DNA-directed RNA polymerase subunit RPC12/RpoP
MEYNEYIVVTYTCESCNTLNKVRDPKKTGGRWRCGRCGHVILHRKRIFHESLILDVRQQLEFTLLRLREIKFPIFSQGKINEIEKINQKYRSKVESWLDHISYLKSEEERNEIFDSYKPDLNEIEKLTILVSDEIKDARWFRDKLQGFDIVRKIVVSTSYTMKAIASVLAFFGLDGFVKAISGYFSLEAIEDLSK